MSVRTVAIGTTVINGVVGFKPCVSDIEKRLVSVIAINWLWHLILTSSGSVVVMRIVTVPLGSYRPSLNAYRLSRRFNKLNFIGTKSWLVGTYKSNASIKRIISERCIILWHRSVRASSGGRYSFRVITSLSLSLTYFMTSLYPYSRRCP